MIKLKNRTTQPRIYNLTHRYYCTGDGAACACRRTVTHQDAKASNGAGGYRIVRHSVPAVLTILVGETVVVRAEALQVPEIAQDVKARRLMVERLPEAGAARVPVETSREVTPAAAVAVGRTRPRSRSRAQG